MTRPAGANTPRWLIWVMVAVFIGVIAYAVEVGKKVEVDIPPSPAVSAGAS